MGSTESLCGYLAVGTSCLLYLVPFIDGTALDTTQVGSIEILFQRQLPTATLTTFEFDDTKHGTYSLTRRIIVPDDFIYRKFVFVAY